MRLKLVSSFRMMVNIWRALARGINKLNVLVRPSASSVCGIEVFIM